MTNTNLEMQSRTVIVQPSVLNIDSLGRDLGRISNNSSLFAPNPFKLCIPVFQSRTPGRYTASITSLSEIWNSEMGYNLVVDVNRLSEFQIYPLSYDHESSVFFDHVSEYVSGLLQDISVRLRNAR